MIQEEITIGNQNIYEMLKKGPKNNFNQPKNSGSKFNICSVKKGHDALPYDKSKKIEKTHFLSSFQNKKVICP